MLDCPQLKEKTNAVSAKESCFMKNLKWIVIGCVVGIVVIVGVVLLIVNATSIIPKSYKECCGIRELKIGNKSFPLYSCCVVEANESLALFDVSWWSFVRSSLVLRDLEELECVRIGSRSFEKSLHSVIESVGWSVG